MLDLNDLESRTIYIVREAYAEFERPAVLWSMGKDSTTMLWLCRKAFFGKIPFPVIHIDTGYKFKQMYTFRDEVAKEWGLDLVIARNEEALKEGISPKDGKFECCTRFSGLGSEAIRSTGLCKTDQQGHNTDDSGAKWWFLQRRGGSRLYQKIRVRGS